MLPLFKSVLSNAYGFLKMNLVTQAQILEEAVCILYSTNTLRNGMNRTGEIQKKTELFNLVKVTDLLEEKLNSNQLYST